MQKSSWGIRVSAASRLSFTLIDMNGVTGRRNGIAAISLNSPSFQATLFPSEKLVITTEDGNKDIISSAENLIAALQAKLDGFPVKVLIEHSIPSNTGFGSKSTSLMALGKAYAALLERSIATDEIALMAQRGGTSGASVNLVDRGGFLVDGGHANPADFESDPQKYLLPSRYAMVAKVPPVLVSLKFPAWPILIVIGAGKNVQGTAELDWFRRTIPISLDDARKTAHLVLMNLAPSIAESDYMAFCRAVNAITFDTFFKRPFEKGGEIR